MKDRNRSYRHLDILVVRNDKIGDFMLSWPAIALLKQNLPDAQISVLVPEYTAELAEMNPCIDQIVIDTGGTAKDLLPVLKAASFDAVLCLYSTRRVALACWMAKIPMRLAPATKSWQWLFNHRVKQRRSKSKKPEYVYNLECAFTLLQALGDQKIEPVRGPYLKTPASVRPKKHPTEKPQHSVRQVLIHCGDGGSARNLSLDQYQQLAQGIAQFGPVQITFTAGPGELTAAQHQQAQLPGSQLYQSSDSIRPFVELIAAADLFVSGSTGPLHIAGALDTPTLGFYPRRRSATALRWQTLNSASRRQACSPPEDADEEDMSSIDIQQCLNSLKGWWYR